MKDYLTQAIGDLVKRRSGDLATGAKFAYKKEMVTDLLVATSDTFNTVTLDINNNLTYSPMDPNSIVVYKETTSIYYQRYTDWTCDVGAGTIKFLSTGDIVAGTDIVVEYKYYSAVGAITAAAILAALLTVDGEGSGLDADLLDGLEAAAFALVNHVSDHENGGGDEMNVGGLSGELADGQPPKAHDLAGGSHNIDTLADLNSKLSDATLDDSGDPRTDDDAIHDDVAGEISAITEKATPHNDDLLVIEDSESSNAKKRLKISNLPGGNGGGTDNDITPPPDDDNGYEGFHGTFTAGENLVAGELCYFKNDGKFWKTAANTEATTGGLLGIASGTINADATGIFLLQGFFRHDAWDWSVATSLYVSNSGGEFAVDPGSNERMIGFVYNADCIYFNPDLMLYVAPGIPERAYGFFGGGTTGSASNIVDYIDATTTSGNALDKGDLTVARITLAGCAGVTYGFFAGGYPGDENVIDYINVTTTSGNASDKGNLTATNYSLAGCAGSTYGFFGGGYSGSATDMIDYIDVTTTSGNALDKGDLTAARDYIASCAGLAYGFFAGGSGSNVIDYIDITTSSGNASDTGDLDVNRYGMSGCAGSAYGFFAGGYGPGISNVIEYIDVTTTSGNASDKGDLTAATRNMPGGVADATYGFFGGGNSGSRTNVIEYINITTTSGNAADKGDLTAAREYLAGA